MPRIPANEIEELRLLLRQHPLSNSLVDYIASGLTERRWIFDHLWSIPYAARAPWVNRQYYAGCNDDHIFTALKRAIALEAQCN